MYRAQVNDAQVNVTQRSRWCYAQNDIRLGIGILLTGRKQLKGRQYLEITKVDGTTQ